MLAQPEGGPVLRDQNGNSPIVHHNGFGRVLYCCGMSESVTEVQGRLNSYAAAAGFALTDACPITYVSTIDLALHKQPDRQAFEVEFLAAQKFDLVVFDPLRRVDMGHDFTILRTLRRWSARHNLTIVAVNTCQEPGPFPAPVDARLTLDRYQLSARQSLCLLHREPGLPAMTDLRLVDLGDPLGFRVAV
jgi:hypothetical protein